MATSRHEIGLDLTFNADTKKAKQQIQDLMSSIREISQNPISIADDLDLQEAVSSARELERYLSQATNVDTGKLDISKFSQSLTKSGKDLSYFQNNLLKLGDSGQTAFLNLAKSIAQAELPAAQLNSKITSLMDNLKKTVQWQLSNTIVRGFIGSVQTAYGYAQDLNKSLNDIRIVTGYNADRMADFAARANDAAKALSTSTTNYTNASLIYYQQGKFFRGSLKIFQWNI